MKLLRIFGLVFNVILFFSMFYSIYTIHKQTGEWLDFKEEKLLSVSLILTMISFFIPTIFIRQIVETLLQKEIGRSKDPNLLDQDLDSFNQSSKAGRLTIADFGIAKFWVAFSGTLQIFLAIYFFGFFLEPLSNEGLSNVNIVILIFLALFFMNGIISLLYLKK